MAERKGFEPLDPVKGQRFSRPPRSTTPAPLHTGSGIVPALLTGCLLRSAKYCTGAVLLTIYLPRSTMLSFLRFRYETR